jgi:ribosome maturation factor RimP
LRGTKKDRWPRRFSSESARFSGRSPRALRKPAHFRNVLGRKVAIRTGDNIGGRKRFRGELLAAGEGAITVHSGETDFDIPYETIVRGNLIDEGKA